MTIILYMALSIDGIAALDGERGIQEYGSKEDRDFFIQEAKNCDAVIMGRRTAKNKIKGVKNFVLCHDESAFKAEDDGVERIFLSGSAQEIRDKIEAYGVQKAALLGGPSTNADFLRAGLVDQIFLTVEPVTIGRGIHFLEQGLESRWTLAGSKVLNERGTIVLHYKKDCADAKSAL